MPNDALLRGLDPAAVRARAKVDGRVVVVTDTLLRVGTEDYVDLDVAIRDIRRIEFDIEHDRPATLVIVPLSPFDRPQMVIVQPAEYTAAVGALLVVATRMATREHAA